MISVNNGKLYQISKYLLFVMAILLFLINKNNNIILLYVHILILGIGIELNPQSQIPNFVIKNFLILKLFIILTINH